MFLQAHRLGGVEEVTYPRWKPGQLLELKRIDRWVSWLDYPTLLIGLQTGHPLEVLGTLPNVRLGNAANQPVIKSSALNPLVQVNIFLTQCLWKTKLNH